MPVLQEGLPLTQNLVNCRPFEFSLIGESISDCVCSVLTNFLLTRPTYTWHEMQGRAFSIQAFISSYNLRFRERDYAFVVWTG